MELKDQVCSLDLAKRLKELGVKQESYFFWWHRWEGSSSDDAGKDIIRPYDSNPSHCIPVAAAFTVAELGEMLPEHVASYRVDGEEEPNYWTCIKYIPGEHSRYEHVLMAATEADVRAKMLIYLIENKLITV